MALNLKKMLGMNDDIASMDVNTHRQPTRDVTAMPAEDNSKTYYYVGAIYNSEPVVLGRFYSWEQAIAVGKKKLPCRFEIYPLNTADMRKATKIVKFDLLEKSNMGVVMNRARHVIEPNDDGEDNVEDIN